MNQIVLNLVTRGFGWNLVRNIFGWLDVVVYTVFSWVMGLLVDITHFNTATQLGDFYTNIQARIFAILSIYMLFKVTISILTYIVNPDSLTDKSQGAGKLVQRIIIVLIMLIAIAPRNTNNIFIFLNRLQTDIIEENTIMKVVLGSDSSAVSNLEETGQKIGLAVYNGTFFKIADTGESIAAINDTEVNSVDDLVWMINDPKSDSERDEYRFTYYPLIGTAVGVIMDILVLSICIDIAIRVFKLIILQVIAPIPIISYIDPKSSKDGAFSKWLKLFISTWAEIFVRLFIVYFVLFLIVNLTENASGFVNGSDNPFVVIVLIIGLLFFAKNAPKFIYDALGMKPPERSAFAGFGNMLAAGAIGAGAISGGIAGFSASRLADTANNVPHNKLNTLKNIGAGLFGAAGGVTTGIGAATNAKDHNARAVMEAMSKRNDAAIAAGAAGSTALGRAMSMGSRVLTGQTAAMRMDRSIAKMQAQKDALSNIKSRISGEMVKQRWTQGDLGIKNDNAGNSIGMVNYKDFMAAKNAAAAAGSSTVDFKDANGVSHTISMEQAELQSGFLLKNNEDDYIKRATGEVRDSSGAVVFSGDDTLNGLIDIATEAGATVSDRKSVTTVVDELGIAITNAKNANETNKQNDRFAGKK